MKEQILNIIALPAGRVIKVGNSYLLTQDRIEDIATRLQHFMEDQRPYLKFGYSIRDLATDIHVPAYQLSAYLNRQVGLNFNDFLNQFRVRYCEDLIKNGMDYQLNLKGLAFKCGFSNRNTLTTAFKKFTGFTPSCYSKPQVRTMTMGGKVA